MEAADFLKDSVLKDSVLKDSGMDELSQFKEAVAQAQSLVDRETDQVLKEFKHCSDMYEKDELCIGAPAIRGYILEGEKRPGHFDGMLQVVMKLLNLSSADRAYFGKKDAQQLALIMQMVKNYFMDVQVIPCEIVRDEKGLALSSRNVYLDEKEKNRALCLSKSLKKATKLVMAGELNVDMIKKEMLHVLDVVDEVEYVAIVDREFNALKEVEIGNTIILVAAWVGKPRLIDNLWI